LVIESLLAGAGAHRDFVVAPPGTIRAAVKAAPVVVKVLALVRPDWELPGKASMVDLQPGMEVAAAAVPLPLEAQVGPMVAPEGRGRRSTSAGHHGPTRAEVEAGLMIPAWAAWAASGVEATAARVLALNRSHLQALRIPEEEGEVRRAITLVA